MGPAFPLSTQKEWEVGEKQQENDFNRLSSNWFCLNWAKSKWKPAWVWTFYKNVKNYFLIKLLFSFFKFLKINYYQNKESFSLSPFFFAFFPLKKTT